MESSVHDRIYPRALQLCLTYLLKDLQIDDVMDAMETADVIKQTSLLRDIKDQTTTTDKIRTLVHKMQTMDKTVYDAFLESLDKVGQSHLKKKLQAAEIEIRKEREEAKKRKEQQKVTNEETLLTSVVATPSGAHAGGDTGTLQAATTARRTTDTDRHMTLKNKQQTTAEYADRDVQPNTNILQTYPVKGTTTNSTSSGENTSGELTGGKGTKQNSAEMDTSKPKEETNALATAQYAISGEKGHGDILPHGNVPCSTETNTPGNVDRQVNADPSEVLPALTEQGKSTKLPSKHVWWRRLIALMVMLMLLAFLLSIPWEFVRLYQSKVAERIPQIKTGTPVECMPEQVSMAQTVRAGLWWQFSLGDDPCLLYHKALLVDPIWEVSPSMVIFSAFSHSVVFPIEVLFGGLGRAFRLFLAEIPVPLQPVMLIFLIIVLVLALIMLFGYRIHLPFLTVEPIVGAPLRPKPKINRRHRWFRN